MNAKLGAVEQVLRKGEGQKAVRTSKNGLSQFYGNEHSAMNKARTADRDSVSAAGY